MKNFNSSTKLDRRTEERVRRIVDLSRRRDRTLEALAALAWDYEAARMPCAAADLRKRLEWYHFHAMKGKKGSGERIRTILRYCECCFFI